MKNFQQSHISITQSNSSSENNEDVQNINKKTKKFTTREIMIQEYFWNYYGTDTYSKLFYSD